MHYSTSFCFWVKRKIWLFAEFEQFFDHKSLCLCNVLYMNGLLDSRINEAWPYFKIVFCQRCSIMP